MPIYPGAFEVEDIPTDRVFLGLRYSKPAASLLVHFEVGGPDGHKVKRLFARPVVGGRYGPVAAPPDGVSQDSLALACEVPLLFINELTVSPPGYDWSGLRSVNLVSGEQSTLLTPETISRRPADVRAWVSDLIDASPDGSRVICTRAAEGEPDAGGNSRVVYEVVELDVAAGSITAISELKSTFF